MKAVNLTMSLQKRELASQAETLGRKETAPSSSSAFWKLSLMLTVGGSHLPILKMTPFSGSVSVTLTETNGDNIISPGRD